MKETIKREYNKWRYLGFSKEILQHYEEGIALENLNVLQVMLWTAIVIIIVIWVLLHWAMMLSPYTSQAIVRTARVLIFTMAIVVIQLLINTMAKKAQIKVSKKVLSKFSTVLFLSVVDVSVIIIEVVFYPNAYSTIVCGLLLISQIMFISYPIDNLIYIVCFMLIFIAFDFLFKEPDILIYDLLDSVPFLVVGLVLSWKNSHTRWEIIIRSEHEKQLELENMENKLKESRIDIMLTQIQPHFIYNTLEGIRELCHTNPAHAEKAVTEFSRYLRGNLSVLNDQRIIPFEQELSHVKHYLYCEKMRFDERLNIVYDIQTTDFSIPTLSLQPIVENAVRYGVSKKEDGGTVTIVSKETEQEWLVIVTDDGDGFIDPIQEGQKRQHIGIENVRSRLKQQCGGDLEIQSEAGIGTKVTIRIPKI